MSWRNYEPFLNRAQRDSLEMGPHTYPPNSPLPKRNDPCSRCPHKEPEDPMERQFSTRIDGGTYMMFVATLSGKLP